MCKIQKLFKYSNMNVRRNISTACLEKRVSIQSKCAMRSVKMSNTQRNEVFDLIWKMQYQTNTTTTVHLHEFATKGKFQDVIITMCYRIYKVNPMRNLMSNWNIPFQCNFQLMNFMIAFKHGLHFDNRNSKQKQHAK